MKSTFVPNRLVRVFVMRSRCVHVRCWSEDLQLDQGAFRDDVDRTHQIPCTPHANPMRGPFRPTETCTPSKVHYVVTCLFLGKNYLHAYPLTCCMIYCSNLVCKKLRWIPQSHWKNNITALPLAGTYSHGGTPHFRLPRFGFGFCVVDYLTFL